MVMQALLSFLGTVVDSFFTIVGNLDASKKMVFQVDTQATASTMTYDVGAQTAGRTVTVPVLTADGFFAFQNFGNVFTTAQTIELGSGALPSIPSIGPAFIINMANSAAAAIEGRGFGVQGFRAESTMTGGTRASPTAVPGSLDTLVLAMRGYNGTSYTGTAASYVIRTDTTAWSGTNNGTYHVWFGTPDGTTVQAEIARLQGGNLLIGTATNITGTGGLCINSATLITTRTSFTNGAAAALGTLTNAPVAGNPTKWLPINDNGTTRYIPAW